MTKVRVRDKLLSILLGAFDLTNLWNPHTIREISRLLAYSSAAQDEETDNG
jgi:hypothetical protein